MYRNGRVVNLRDHDERWIASLDRMDIRGNEHERRNNNNRYRNNDNRNRNIRFHDNV